MVAELALPDGVDLFITTLRAVSTLPDRQVVATFLLNYFVHGRCQRPASSASAQEVQEEDAAAPVDDEDAEPQDTALTGLLTSDHISALLSIAPNFPPSILGRLITVFGLPISTEQRLEFVRQALATRKIRDAGFLALRLNVHDMFPLEDICLPLIVKGDVELACKMVEFRCG
jgi:hypothetical protein